MAQAILQYEHRQSHSDKHNAIGEQKGSTSMLVQFVREPLVRTSVEMDCYIPHRGLNFDLISWTHQLRKHLSRLCRANPEFVKMWACLIQFWSIYSIFEIKLLCGTFKALQKKQFGPKFFELHAWVKKCQFGNFSERAGDGRALLVRPSKMHHSIWKILFVLGADKYLERLEGKIRKCLFFYVKISQE